MAAAAFLDFLTVERLMADTPPGTELAMHSDVLLQGGERRHIVMIDMSTAAKAHLEKLRAFIGNNFYQRMTWYESGRSFHGYGEDLLGEREWVQFMGLLLLSNKPRLEPTVDPRWIGHRLLAGYSSLRWTKNTSHYLSLPSLLDGQRQTLGASLDIGPSGRPLRRG